MERFQVVQVSSEQRLIVDERLLALGTLLKHWSIAGPNELHEFRLHKTSDLRLLINGSAFRRQEPGELRVPLVDASASNVSAWLKHYLESDKTDDHSTFLNTFIETLQRMNGQNDEDNLDSVVSSRACNLSHLSL